MRMRVCCPSYEGLRVRYMEKKKPEMWVVKGK